MKYLLQGTQVKLDLLDSLDPQVRMLWMVFQELIIMKKDHKVKKEILVMMVKME